MWGHRDVQTLGVGCLGCAGLLAGGLLAVGGAAFSWRVSGGVAAVAAIAGALLAGYALYQQRRTQCRLIRYQLGRSKRALRIARSTMAGRNPVEPYFLYLRPFAIDGAFVEAPRGDFEEDVIEQYGIPTATHDLESALALLVHRHAHLIALSNRLGSAAGKVRTTDDRWKEEVAALCEHAEGIFVVPFYFPGTAWEVTRIAENPAWLHKTLFLMPARPPIAWPARTPDYRALWEEGRREYDELGLALPEYDERGGVVVVREEPRFIRGFGGRRAFRGVREGLRDREGLDEARRVVAELAASNPTG